MVLLYGCAGRLTTQNGGFLPRQWGDGSVTQGPGCMGTKATAHCMQCQPPLYEMGAYSKGTGGCNCKAVDCGGYMACKCP